MTIEFIPSDQAEETKETIYQNFIRFQVPVEVEFCLPNYTKEPASPTDLLIWIAENPEKAHEMIKESMDEWSGVDVTDKIKTDAIELVEKGMLKHVSCDWEKLEDGER